jgi:predicted amidohydrolase YtcJ
MHKRTIAIVGVAGGILAAALAVSMSAQQAAPDLVLTNGKIITVDERFTIAQAVAIKGDRIIAVGTSQAINQLAGSGTRRIELNGRAVVPGLIDNHAHYMEEGALWQLELRLDGVETRRQALEMVRAKAQRVPAGEWVFSLGGWSTDQFTDDSKPFSRDELDKVAPNHPVLLQFTRAETYLNSAALKALALDSPAADPKTPWVKRDASGRPTGVIDAAGADPVRSKIPEAKGAVLAEGNLAMVRDLNRAGLTASGGTCPDEYMEMYRQWAREGRLNKRFFCLASIGAGSSAATVDRALPQIAALKLFQGDAWVDQFAYGEGFYGPASDNMVAVRGTQRPEDFVQWGRIAREVAKAGMPANIHTTLESTADGFLTEIEAIDKEFPIRNLRWALIHGEQLNASHLARMKKLGMYASIQPRATIMGAIFNRVHGDRSYEMPNLKMIQDSGIMWGLGTDTFEVNQYRPFTTLWFAVTGKMVGGKVVNRTPISREDALIAHTRRNAFFLFQENNLGSIQPGKLADLVVIDRDYLTVPADQIKDITSVMTIVGGRIAYDAEAKP